MTRPSARVEVTSYHNCDGEICPYEFLPARTEEVRTVCLTPAEREQKRRFLYGYRTQQETLRYFPVEIERFRPAPLYDFSQAPHPGTLFYECFPWGMTGERFRELAAGALGRLYRQVAA